MNNIRTSKQNVIFKQEDSGLVRIILARPECHNAFDDETILDLIDIFITLSDDESARVVILEAEGKSFCAGADLNWMRSMINYNYQENVADALNLARMLSLLDSLPQPTIAKIQGDAYGGALGLIACCDIAIACKSAHFCFSEVKIGLVPATISPYILSAIGERAARRYFQTAEIFNAEKAETLGLVSEVVEIEDLDECVDTITNKLLKNGVRAMRASKNLISNISNRTVDDELMQYTSECIAAARISSEGQERLNAFLNRKNKVRE